MLAATLISCLAPFAAAVHADPPEDSAALNSVSGRYVKIISNCLQPQEATELAAAFDAAVPRWCDYLQCDVQRLQSWRVTAYVMESREAMAEAKVLPSELPPFHNGIQRGRSVWIICQPGDYYTRHLLLHEGVHAIYAQLFGATGPGWYQEGMAELLSTHRWNTGAIELPIVPESRQSSGHWGRFKVLDQWRQSGKAPSMDAMMNYRHSATDSPAPYAWAWSLASLSGGYPEFRRALVDMRHDVGLPASDFGSRFRSALGTEPWPLRWRILVDEFDYGYDLQRNALRAAQTAGPRDAFVVAADAGWQDTGLTVTSGQTVSITATGRYQIGSEPKPWVCEPQGVTIRYHRGRPLGMLLATVAGEGIHGGVVRPLRIQPVGTGAAFTAAESGRLLLRIGDDPAQLADNSGSAAATVEIRSE